MVEQFRHDVAVDAPFYVAGHSGLVGSAVWRALEKRGHTRIIGVRSSELDLRDRHAVDSFFDEQRPTYVLLAAARVGGIMANSTYPADFLSDNLRIQVNVLDAAARVGVRRLLFLGSSCIYPKYADQPIREDSLLTGTLEPTNDAYAIAKLAGVLHVQALRRQHGVSFISAMPTNLYGVNDNFDPETSHVLPALLRKFAEAKQSDSPSVELWGTGTPRREFLWADDLAGACLTLMERYDGAEPINIGVGEDITIRDLASLIAEVVDYEGKLTFDTTRPDGTPQKLLDVSRINSLGWKAETSLRDGVTQMYRWFLEQRP